MVNCAYGYPKEIQEEAGEAEEGSAEEETGQEKTGEEKGACEKSSEKKGRSQGHNRPEKGGCTHEEAPAQKRTLLSRDFPAGSFGGSAGQSGDLQGLSRVEDVDSESVNELIEEGNAFEADVVQGVTDAGNADEEEVHTHEVPEDDVPGEYLDKD